MNIKERKFGHSSYHKTFDTKQTTWNKKSSRQKSITDLYYKKYGNGASYITLFYRQYLLCRLCL